MVAATYDIKIEQGTTWNWSLTLYEDEGKTTPIDLTGYSASMDIRTYKEATSKLASFSTVDGSITFSGANNNILTVLASATTTSSWDFYTGVYDLEISNSGVVTRLVEGKVTISKEVTR
jgi:hypothetical protein